MRSMTGYGSAQGENPRCLVSVSMRSQNHRNLDLVLRLKEGGGALEQKVRRLLGERLSRGRVETTVDVVWLEAPPVELALREGAIEEVEDLLAKFEGHAWIQREISAGELLRLPGLVVSRTKEAEISEEDERMILTVVGEAVDGLVEMRQAEGKELRSVVESCVEALAGIRQAIARRRQETLASNQQDLAERVRSLLSEVAAELDDSDDARLVQEVAYLIERSDVREELDRLDSHLEQVRSLLDSGDAIGRRLDFLSQELLRELNTIGSKCRDAATTSLVVDGKVVCDQFREQVQNIE